MQKKPFVSPEKLREIAAVYPTPFHLYDEAGLRRTARGLLSPSHGTRATGSITP